MSYVTNVMLSHCILENGGLYPDELTAPVERLNEALGARAGSGFKRLDPHAGGVKVMESTVYGIAFNYFGQVEELAPFILKAGWKHPKDVQVFICDQDEDRFTLYSWSDLIALVASSDG